MMDESADRSRMQGPVWATLLSTFFGIGWLRPGPGTWGSAAAVLLWGGLAYAITPKLRTPSIIVLSIVITLIAIPAATQASRSYAKKDPQFVVIDEVGQLLVLAVIIANPIRPRVLALHIEILRGTGAVMIIDEVGQLSVLTVVGTHPI